MPPRRVPQSRKNVRSGRRAMSRRGEHGRAGAHTPAAHPGDGFHPAESAEKRGRGGRGAGKPRRNTELVIITGMSGSGKASALKAFEDLGYYCVDNLPVGLIPRFADTVAAHGSRSRRAAVVVDIREGESVSQLPVTYQRLGRDGLNVALLFL